MKYITSKELAEKWNISQRRIVYLASEGKIEGAILYGKSWIFPEQVKRPADGRTKSIKANKKEDFFRYPLFEYKDESSFHPPLNDTEKSIKKFIEAFHAFHFHEAESILNDLMNKPHNRYTYITILYFKCMLSMFLCDTALFLDSYGKLKFELSIDFPYVVEMREYLHEIDAVLGEDEYYSSVFHKRPIYSYHASFFPRFCNLLAIFLALGNKTITPVDLTAHEVNSFFLDKTDNVFDSQALHLYLACAYNMLNKNEECSYHFHKALVLAEKYNIFYTIATMQYYYSPKSLDDALDGFSNEFKENIKKCNNIFYSSHIRFTNALQMNSLYKHINGSDYLFIVFAVQGLTNKEVAKRLNISIGSVGKRYSEIYLQFGVNNKAELITIYHNLIKKSLV